MNPLGSRARAEELARLLDDPSASGAAAGLAMRLRAIAPALESTAAPRPEFRTALRTRLLAVAEVQAMNAPYAEPAGEKSALQAVAGWSQSRKGQRRIGVTAGAMAGVIAFTGVGMASSRSLPGQPFYALKRSAEGLQLSFVDGDQAKGAKHLEFAANRLREVEALADGRDALAVDGTGTLAAGTQAASRQDRIRQTLEDFDRETATGRELLESAFRATGKQDPLRILRAFAKEQRVVLKELLPALPAGSVTAAEESLALVEEVFSETTEQLALGICGGECFPSNRGPELPREPMPLPGATASPSPRSDNNGVPDCECGPTPEPSPEPSQSPSPEPSSSPTPTATPSPSASPSPTPSPSSSPDPLPIPLPVPLPTDLPPLPVPLPQPLPSLVPVVLSTVEDAISPLG